MEFKNIEVKNFKQFSDLSITFQPGINILLGGNGVGKTSVLEALSIALSDYFNGNPQCTHERNQCKSNSVRYTCTGGCFSRKRVFFCVHYFNYSFRQ